MMIKEIPKFISDETCKDIINRATPFFQKALTRGEQIEGYRVADAHWFDNSDELSVRIRNIVSDAVRIPVDNMERLHVVRYKVGGEYKEHHDFFAEGVDYYEEAIKAGGQRTKTALIYLNSDFTGGETSFPLLGINVIPETGKILIWDNADENGFCIVESLHAGKPVISGEKYIALFWFRQNKI